VRRNLTNDRLSIRGLSVIELLIALALASLLLRAAIPGVTDLIAHYRATAASNAVIGAVQLARSAAIVHRTRVVFCPNNQGSCGRARDWHLGGLIFADDNRNGRRDEGERLFGTLPALPPGSHLSWRSFRNRSYLMFLPSGLTAWQNGHFQYCPADSNPRFARQLILNA
jgi:type IV fimbrial biogenesis protein FimT